MSGLPESIGEFVRLVGIEPLPVQRQMAAFADEEQFPIIGPEVGGLLSVLARLVSADCVFEMGSGFGYSASWFARGIVPGGTIVLTEYDEEELAYAQDFFRDAEFECEFKYEQGDAISVSESYDGPFDIVLLDHEKSRYVDGFEQVRQKMTPNGVVLADNMMQGPVEFDDVLRGLEDTPSISDEATSGVVRYLQHVRDDPEFFSTVIPMGNGVTLSVKL